MTKTLAWFIIMAAAGFLGGLLTGWNTKRCPDIVTPPPVIITAPDTASQRLRGEYEAERILRIDAEKKLKERMQRPMASYRDSSMEAQLNNIIGQ